MKNPIRRIRPVKTGLGAPLGDLEAAVMRHVWACGAEGCQGSDVQRALQQERPIALTTVLTTLDRLCDKGILGRQRDQRRAYRYWPLLSEEQLQRQIVDHVLGNLIHQFPRAVVSYLVQEGLYGTPGADETDRLAELAKRVETMARLRHNLSEASIPDAGEDNRGEQDKTEIDNTPEDGTPDGGPSAP